MPCRIHYIAGGKKVVEVIIKIPILSRLPVVNFNESEIKKDPVAKPVVWDRPIDKPLELLDYSFGQHFFLAYRLISHHREPLAFDIHHVRAVGGKSIGRINANLQ
jgi:hypothetical protein